MENFNRKCSKHPNFDFNFYCFDDKSFLCDICFKEHRKHNVEVKSELEKFDGLYKTLNRGKPLNKKLEEIKLNLTQVRDSLDKNLLPKISSLSDTLNKSANTFDNSIFNLDFKGYENVNEFIRIGSFLDNITKKINDLKKIYEVKKYTGALRKISREVKVLEASPVQSDYVNVDVMLGKKEGLYSLFEGQQNIYAIFDFPKKLFLKNVLISVKQSYGCVLKNFRISVLNDKGKWEFIRAYVCKDNNYEKEFQEFDVSCEAKTLRFDFLDAWNNDVGNYLLIKRMCFEVCDLN